MRPAGPVQDAPPQVGEGHAHVVGPHLHAQHHVGVVLELQHDGSTPSARRAGADLGDQAGGQDLGHDLRDRRARERKERDAIVQRGHRRFTQRLTSLEHFAPVARRFHAQLAGQFGIGNGADNE